MIYFAINDVRILLLGFLKLYENIHYITETQEYKQILTTKERAEFWWKVLYSCNSQMYLYFHVPMTACVALNSISSI